MISKKDHRVNHPADYGGEILDQPGNRIRTRKVGSCALDRADRNHLIVFRVSI
jgi:hypothetical protein